MVVNIIKETGRKVFILQRHQVMRLIRRLPGCRRFNSGGIISAEGAFPIIDFVRMEDRNTWPYPWRGGFEVFSSIPRNGLFGGEFPPVFIHNMDYEAGSHNPVDFS